MTNLLKLAYDQGGTITIEQLNAAIDELKATVEADKPDWYDRGLWHQTTIYDGECHLLNKILRANYLK